jgi:ATP-dependent DNA helicase RecQ
VTDPDPLLLVLRERFGKHEFRGPQRQVIEAVLAGRDVLLTMPTGAGKSLCYQLPALMLEGLTLVVSPLIALMQDQVDALRELGHRSGFRQQLASIRHNVARGSKLPARGDLKLLYVTPERFRSPDFQAFAPRLRIARMAVDEAHCVSQWGHDFRPDYSRLAEYRAAHRRSAGNRAHRDSDAARGGRHRASARVARSNHRAHRDRAAPSCSSPRRASPSPRKKLPLLAERVRAIDGPGIVYSTLIKDLEVLHADLKRAGIHRPRLPRQTLASGTARDAGALHGERARSRARHQRLRHGRRQGGHPLRAARADPAHARAVDPEVGRAGRDGKPSWCEVLYFDEDLSVQQNFVEWANPSLEYWCRCTRRCAAGASGCRPRSSTTCATSCSSRIARTTACRCA